MSFFTRLTTISVVVLSGVFLYLGALSVADRLSWKPLSDGIRWDQDEDGLLAGSVDERLLVGDRGQGVQTGDRLLSINDIPVRDLDDYVEIMEVFDAHGAESLDVSYRVQRLDQEVSLSGRVERRSSFGSIDPILIFLALIHLGVGCFIYFRSWKTPPAFHFFLVCLAAFVLIFFRYSGRADAFDVFVYWCAVGALLLFPALFLHFCLRFPRPLPKLASMPRLSGMIYLPFFFLSLLHGLWFSGRLQPFGLARTVRWDAFFDSLHLAYFIVMMGCSALVLFKAQRQSADSVERHQMKWITQGSIFGILPLTVFYGIPWILGLQITPLMEFSVLSLGIIPIGFGYAITRYRLMDVDLIFKQGAAYFLTSSALLGIYVAAVLLLGRFVESFHSASGVLVFTTSALLLGFLFAPLKALIQTRIDRYFYRDRYRFRTSFSEFGKTLASEIRLQKLVQKTCDRIRITLNVSAVAVYVCDERDPGAFDRFPDENGSPAAGPDRVNLPREQLGGSRAVSLASGPISETSSVQELREADYAYLLPLGIRGRVIGFVALGQRDGGELLNSEDLDLVSTLTDYAAIAIDNAILYDSLESKALQLSRMKSFNESVVESITVGVTLVDSKGTIKVWNSAMQEFYGLERAGTLGREVESVFSKQLIESMQQLLDGDSWDLSETRTLYKTHVATHSGEERLANVTLTPFVGQSIIDTGLLVLFEDVTTKVQLENQLLQAEKLSSIGLFAAGVAHEVNTPLAGISSYAQMLLEETDPQDERYEPLKKIETQSFRASKIVNNLLNFARLDDSEYRELSLNSLTMETISLLEHQLRKGNVELKVDLDPYLPKTLGNGGKLQQVLINLFLNARDAMPEGGRVEVTTMRKNSEVVLQIRDSGSGISPEHINRIYDPFFTTKEVGKGTGLGLSVSYGIVQEHAGHIQVDSRPGEGTTFSIQLPVRRIS